MTRAIQDPLVLRQLQFAQDFQRRFCAAGDYDDRIPVVGAGRACQLVHTRPFLLASRRFDGQAQKAVSWTGLLPPNRLGRVKPCFVALVSISRSQKQEEVEVTS